MAGSALPAFKAAVYAACRAMYLTQTGVQVSYGHPGTDVEPDLVVVGGARVTSFDPTLGARRREEELELEVVFSCWRAGGPEAQQTATEAAYALMATFEEYARTGTQIAWASTVRESLIVGHQLVESDESNLEQGRIAEVTLTLRAHARH